MIEILVGHFRFLDATWFGKLTVSAEYRKGIMLDRRGADYCHIGCSEILKKVAETSGFTICIMVS